MINHVLVSVICTRVCDIISDIGEPKSDTNIAGRIDLGHCCEIDEPLELEMLMGTYYFLADELYIISVVEAFRVTYGSCG